MCTAGQHPPACGLPAPTCPSLALLAVREGGTQCIGADLKSSGGLPSCQQWLPVTVRTRLSRYLGQRGRTHHPLRHVKGGRALITVPLLHSAGLGKKRPEGLREAVVSFHRRSLLRSPGQPLSSPPRSFPSACYSESEQLHSPVLHFLRGTQPTSSVGTSRSNRLACF